MDEPIHIYSPAYKAKNYITHTKLDYNPPLSLRFNGKELQIVEWGEMKEHYRIYSKEYDSIDTKDMPRLLSSYSLAPDVIDIERFIHLVIIKTKILSILCSKILLYLKEAIIFILKI